MWIELPAVWIVILNCLGIPAVHLLIAWWSTCLPARLFRPEAMFFRPGPWERGGTLYARLLRVRSWNRMLPDAGPWFRGFSKGRLSSRDPAYFRTFIIEACRGEFSHWVQMLAIAGFIAWNPYPFNLVIIGWSLLSNLPCIVNLRYTRLRLQQVVARSSGPNR